MMSDTKTLKNDDFRKILAMPSAFRAAGESESKTSLLGNASHSFTHRQALDNKAGAKKASKGKFKQPHAKSKRDEDDIFAESQAELNELMKKYRDRAAERRKGLLPEDDAELKSKITAAYKAMPSTASAAASLAERRRMEIQESKYLGGDIEHTHLVKGLDYSLLNKVRNELENEEENELEAAYESANRDQEVEQQTNSRLAKNICRVVLARGADQLPKCNDMFARGRMAYVVELEPGEDAGVDTDVPCTLLRSVADCPAAPSSDSFNTDALLISKLEQVLGYLRADLKKRKRAPAEASRDTAALSRQKIYDDVDEHAPAKRDQRPTPSSAAGGGERRDKTSSYFEGGKRGAGDDYRTSKRDDRGDAEQRYRHRDRRDDYDGRRDRRDDYNDRRDRRDNHAKQRDNDSVVEIVAPKEDTSAAKTKRRRPDEEEDDAYAELYPSGIGMLDAIGGESDEEDFSKMDMGNRKGPIKRWDFETEKDYESYQEKREAMPKAAYQYGIKMNGGRKTRKNNPAANEKKLDRELDKINKILDERRKQGK